MRLKKKTSSLLTFKTPAMKKHLLLVAFCSATSLLFAQIQLEHTYPKGSLKRISLDVSGEKYLLTNNCSLVFFRPDHALWKDVTLAPPYGGFCAVKLISEQLIDEDPDIEIVYSWGSDYDNCPVTGAGIESENEQYQWIDKHYPNANFSMLPGLTPKLLAGSHVYSLPGLGVEHDYGLDNYVYRLVLPNDGERYLVYDWAYDDEFEGYHFYNANHELVKIVDLHVPGFKDLNFVTQGYFNDDALLEFFGTRWQGGVDVNGNKQLAEVIKEDGTVLLREPCHYALLNTLPNFPDRLMIHGFIAPEKWGVKVLDVKTLLSLHTFPFQVSRVSPDGSTDFYIHLSDSGNMLSLYNSNFVFEKSIVLSPPVYPNWNVGVTRNRFTQSGKLEFYYTAKNGAGTLDYQVICMDEEGTVLYTFPGANAAYLDQQPGMDDKLFVRYADSTQVYDFTSLTIATPPSPTNADLKIFPNPFSQSFEVQLPQASDYFLRLTDVTGRIVATQSIQNQSSARCNIESNTPSGVYFLTIGGLDFRSTVRLAKK